MEVAAHPLRVGVGERVGGLHGPRVHGEHGALDRQAEGMCVVWVPPMVGAAVGVTVGVTMVVTAGVTVVVTTTATVGIMVGVGS